MSGNGNGTGFRPEGIVRVHNRDVVVIGGRLRVAHASHAKLAITAEVMDYALDQHAVVRARVVTAGGEFTGTGVATAGRDPKLADSLVELAETRAVARALRFAGIGVECVGFEELAAGPALNGDQPRQELRAVPGRATGPAGNGNGSHHPTPATTAQRRALTAIAQRLGKDPDAVVAQAYPDQELADLSLSQASKLIDRLKGTNGTHAGQGR